MLRFVVAACAVVAAASALPYSGVSTAGSGPYTFRTVPVNYTLDHFNFRPHAPGNLSQFPGKYLVNDTFWSPGGPIFFYTGNEGPIELFAQNTGFMWDIAPEFGAMLVFAEHRYYGTSMPFGADTYSDPKSGRLQWLTSEQALADYATLIAAIKQTIAGAEKSPVVAFGGSYGGMLAAWLRMKYPGTVVGTIAASAPVLQFTGLRPPTSYVAVTTNTYRTANPDCATGISKSWGVMESLSETSKGRDTIQSTLGVCQPLTTAENVTGTLFGFFNNAIQYMAMADYPAPASFLGPMPAWPVNYSCNAFTPAPTTDVELLTAMKSLLHTYYNYSGQAGSCFDINTNGPSTLKDAGGWNYQSCTEMVMPIGQYGEPNDMFYVAPWNLQATLDGCQATYGVTPRPEWVPVTYNGLHLSGVSNIVFTNGDLDPWSQGGVLKNVTNAPSIIAYSISRGAHHLDLRSANAQDPPSVVEARNIHRHNIRTWIAEAAQ